MKNDEYVERKTETIFCCRRCKASVVSVGDDVVFRFMPRLPKGWEYVKSFLLCERCLAEYDVLFDRFMGGG